MKDFILKNKTFLGILTATLVILFGGIFLLSKNSSPSTSQKVISSSILISEDAHQSDPAAPVTLVEFGDYQCPACGTYHTLVKQLTADFNGKLNFVFRNFPLPQHANGQISSYAVEAAGLQNKFWQMHDKIYESQDSWSNSTDARSIFVDYAKELGLNTETFKKDIDSQKVKDIVARGTGDGNLIGIDSTPTFFVNGSKIGLPESYDEFKKIIDNAINSKQQVQKDDSQAYHAHFDLKVFINGKAVDLGLAKYQSPEGKELDENIHLHDGNGKIVHLHKKDIKLKQLFDSIKITIPEGIVAYVNGKRIDDILNYMPQDLDQILIGSSDITKVSNDSCIYSQKCPERGTPPPEACVGGLGTDCE